MYRLRQGYVLGFHGCDEKTRDAVISGQSQLLQSKNNWDWLGNGVYFWEHSEKRALEYAHILKKNPHRCSKKIEKPAVLGAVLSLGKCLDLLTHDHLDLLRISHTLFVENCSREKKELPVNKTVNNDPDFPLRFLDCAVIEFLHSITKLNRGRKDNSLSPFDSVRSVFWEGSPLYDGAGFRKNNHIQLCIRNPNCIKGYFLPMEKDPKFVSV